MTISSEFPIIYIMVFLPSFQILSSFNLSLSHHPFPLFSLCHLFPPPSCFYRLLLLHPPVSFPCLRLSPGCHSARLPVGLPGHPTEGVGVHQLLHLYVTPAGDTSILTAAQLRYTPAGFTRKCGSRT